MGGAVGLRARDLRRSSSSRAAASFFNRLDSLSVGFGVYVMGTNVMGAGVLTGAARGVCDRFAPAETEPWRARPVSPDHGVPDRTDCGDIRSPRGPRLLLRLLRLRNLSFASSACLSSSSLSE